VIFFRYFHPDGSRLLERTLTVTVIIIAVVVAVDHDSASAVELDTGKYPRNQATKF
jgi:hypothetical protein